MAITKLDLPTASTPSDVPDIETDYNNQNEIAERHSRGFRGVTLTNWDATTTVPAVVVGSTVEANGVMYDITSGNETIDAGSASSGVIYLVFDDTVPEFKFSSTSPTWSASRNGFYNGSDEKYTGHYMTWDGASSYTAKAEFISNTQGADGASVDYEGVIISGGINTDNARIRRKLFTGTAGIGGAFSGVTHGISSPSTSIVGITAIAYVSSEWRNYINTTGTPIVVNIGATEIDGSTGTASSPYAIIVDYLA